MGNDNTKPGANGPDTVSSLSEEELRQRKIQLMDTAMSKKFGRGGAVHNMRVVIKGAARTGKSALFRRLQGKPFEGEYTPTRELQSAHVNWKHKTDSSAVVKVEVWDVVDKSTENETLDVDKYGERAAYYLASGAGHSVGRVDADLIDVFRGAHAMVITSNPADRATYEYIQQVLQDPRLPSEFPIAILANFRDLNQEPQVTREEYAALAAADPRHRFMFECSCKNCYGLKELYEFLTVPFLKLQERALQERLQSVCAESNAVQSHMAELRARQDYTAFIAELSAASEKAKAAAAAPNPAPAPARGNPMVKTFTLEEPGEEPEPKDAAPASQEQPDSAQPGHTAPEEEPAAEDAGASPEAADEDEDEGGEKDGGKDGDKEDDEEEDEENEEKKESKPVPKEASPKQTPTKEVDTSVLDEFDTGEIDDDFWD